MAAADYPACEKRVLTSQDLQSILDYDPDSGKFTWKISTGCMLAGDVAGSINNLGYWVIGVSGKVYKAHRLAWLYMTGRWPTEQIDHCDRNKSNNVWNNLREASNSKNKANGLSYKGRRLDLPKGVYPNRHKFTAQIRVLGKCFYLGIYDDPSDAHAAYIKAAKHHFGEFANGS